MPKIIELTVEIDIQRVSCPGVWLCQDGRVSLTVFALGTSYQTCLLPPMFPLMFKDIFYFRKRFQETCALNNICCLLKDETIYCELVQWCQDCATEECTMLAQYLGALNEVLFPPNMCSNDGVDLLMRRSKAFPGILSPKIEIATKVRIDEVWSQSSVPVKSTRCYCKLSEVDGLRQKQVCHTPLYHRTKCNTAAIRPSSGSRSRSRSGGASLSCCTLTPKEQEMHVSCKCPHPVPRSPRPPRSAGRARRQYNVYNVSTGDVADVAWTQNDVPTDDYDIDLRSMESEKQNLPSDDRLQKILLESRYIDDINKPKEKPKRAYVRPKISPCVCEICKKYHELFHTYL